MPTVKNYIALMEGVCGAEKEIIVTLKDDKKDAVTSNILKRCQTKKSSSFMTELEFQDVTFRLFSNGRIIFRSVKNRKELNRLLTALLL